MERITWIKQLIDKFYGIFMSNMIFLISNLLLVIVLLRSRESMPSLVEVYIPILLLSPALTALNYTMGKFFRFDDICVIENYLKGYKLNFISSIKTGIFLFTPVIMIMYTIRTLATPFYYLQVIAILILCIMTFYAYPLLSRYHTSVKSLMILSFISLFKQVKLTLVLLFVYLVMFLMLLLYPSISVLFAFSTAVYMSMFLLNRYLESFES